MLPHDPYTRTHARREGHDTGLCRLVGFGSLGAVDGWMAGLIFRSLFFFLFSIATGTRNMHRDELAGLLTSIV